MLKTLCEEFQEELSAYALGDLEEGVNRRFRMHLETCLLCRKELMETEDALHMLPLGLTAAKPPSNLKSKLQARIQSMTAFPVAAVIDFDAIEWEDCDIPGVRFHWLRKDENGTTAAFVRIPPGFMFPDHRHLGNEDSLVLQGGFRDSSGEYDRGDYIHYEAGTVQEGLVALDGEDCILFIVTQQGIEFLT